MFQLCGVQTFTSRGRYLKRKRSSEPASASGITHLFDQRGLYYVLNARGCRGSKSPKWSNIYEIAKISTQKISPQIHKPTSRHLIPTVPTVLVGIRSANSPPECAGLYSCSSGAWHFLSTGAVFPQGQIPSCLCSSAPLAHEPVRLIPSPESLVTPRSWAAAPAEKTRRRSCSAKGPLPPPGPLLTGP